MHFTRYNISIVEVHNMNTYQHERIIHEKHIPAMIAIVERNDIQEYFPVDIFIPAHWHRSLEIALIEQAEVSLQIGEQEYRIEDDFTCVNSGVVHSLRANMLKTNPKCIILILSYEFMKEYYPQIDDVFFDLNKNQNHDALKELYYKLEYLYKHQEAFTYLEITACILEIYKLLLSEYRVERENLGKKTLKYQNQIKEILTYLHEHYMEELSLLEVANLFHISKEYFSRQFHTYVGKTYRDYITSYRLYKAYEDVIHSSLTIQSIASKHGFSSSRSFIKTFYDAYHETPLKYRKCHQVDIK